MTEDLKETTRDFVLELSMDQGVEQVGRDYGAKGVVAGVWSEKWGSGHEVGFRLCGWVVGLRGQGLGLRG